MEAYYQLQYNIQILDTISFTPFIQISNLQFEEQVVVNFV